MLLFLFLCKFFDILKVMKFEVLIVVRMFQNDSSFHKNNSEVNKRNF